MTRPRVSVIVPSYNYGHFLKNRIDSILNQTVRDTEIICIDDGSTDGSRTVMELYRNHPRVRLVFNERNHGSPFYSWNLGVSLASADYIWIAEADDLADSSFLARLVEVLDNHVNVGVVYCQSAVIDEQGNTTGSLLQWMQGFERNRWSSDFIENGKTECRIFFSRFCEIANVSSAVMRRQAYVSAGGADESYRLVGDWKLYLLLLQEWDIGFVAEPLNRFRRHSSSIREISARSGDDIVEMYTLAKTVFPLLELCQPYARMAYDSLLDSWCSCATRLWERVHKPLHVRVYELARSVDVNVTKATLGHIFLTCGFSALRGGDPTTASHWFLDAIRYDRRLLRNRGVLAITVKYFGGLTLS